MAYKSEWTLKKSVSETPYIVTGKEELQDKLKKRLERLSNNELINILKEIGCPYSGLNKSELIKYLSYNLAKDYPSISLLFFRD